MKIFKNNRVRDKGKKKIDYLCRLLTPPYVLTCTAVSLGGFVQMVVVGD